ncbi:hypothetical protein AVEN_215171-1 [Araneus ventricosus]|uniref:Uncharacterized protein n=1 Tax=Araneus ventricosus TaxID=182803 RepID=A0A4Y2FNK0_ARAVE|nr:hypothetical protein AVEN_215171-1 [Araneus ventricosus]
MLSVYLILFIIYSKFLCSLFYRSISNSQNGETHSQEQKLRRGTTLTPSNSYTKDSYKTWKVMVQSFRRPSKNARGSENYRVAGFSTNRETILKRMGEEKGHDGVDLFFESIAKSAKKLRSDLIYVAKMLGDG